MTLIKAHVQLTAKRVKEHIQANVTGVFYEQNFFQLSSVNYYMTHGGDCIKLTRTELMGMQRVFFTV